MAEFLDVIHKESKQISIIIDELVYYARALDIVGNDKLSNDLFNLADTLKISIHEIDKAVTKRIHDDYKHSMKNSKTLLKACLVMNDINNGFD
jgi:AAA+ ATPase superfamily predicted ATPase